MRGSHCKDQAGAAIPTTAAAVKKNTEKSERTEEIMARTKVQPKRGSKSRMEARPINARQRLNGGETVRKGRCPLNPAPPGALAGAKARQSCSNGGETVRKGRCPLNPALPGAFRSQRPDPPSPLLPALLLPFYYSITARARGALPPLNPPPRRGLSPRRGLIFFFCSSSSSRSIIALPQEQGGRCPP